MAVKIGNPCKGGGGYIMRNQSGDMIWALNAYFAEVSNMEAEAMVLRKGLEFFMDFRDYDLIIESDSKVLVDGDILVTRSFESYRTRASRISGDGDILVTDDNFEFWFMGFLDYHKTIKYIQEAICQAQ